MNEIKIITAADWHVSATSSLGELYYPYRFSTAEIKGVPGVMPPKVLYRKNYNTNNIEYIKNGEDGRWFY